MLLTYCKLRYLMCVIILAKGETYFWREILFDILEWLLLNCADIIHIPAGEIIGKCIQVLFLIRVSQFQFLLIYSKIHHSVHSCQPNVSASNFQNVMLTRIYSLASDFWWHFENAFTRKVSTRQRSVGRSAQCIKYRMYKWMVLIKINLKYSDLLVKKASIFILP